MGYAVIQDPRTGIVTFDSRMFDLEPDQQEQIRWLDKQIFELNRESSGIRNNPKLANLVSTRRELMRIWSGFPREIAPWPADEREERIAGEKVNKEWLRTVTDY